VSALIAGTGTPETLWRPWLDGFDWPALDLGALAGRRVVALAAHPDDEVLGVGGLLASLSGRGSEIVAVWATDGEASHPGSRALGPGQLGWLRREESRRALTELGVVPALSAVLGLPDGGLADCVPALRAGLRDLIGADDVVLAPWRLDGHPDHEAIGEVAAELTTTLLEYPIWMWHWAGPEDSRVPWSRLRTIPVDDPAAKARAIDAFDTQVRPIGPAAEDAAILPPHVVARFLRPCEAVFL
jgi:LmbE family N-acetylglucosaminyl deacetylase